MKYFKFFRNLLYRGLLVGNASVPGDVADLNVSVASAVVLDSAVANVISAVGVA